MIRSKYRRLTPKIPYFSFRAVFALIVCLIYSRAHCCTSMQNTGNSGDARRYLLRIIFSKISTDY